MHEQPPTSNSFASAGRAYSGPAYRFTSFAVRQPSWVVRCAFLAAAAVMAAALLILLIPAALLFVLVLVVGAGIARLKAWVRSSNLMPDREGRRNGVVRRQH